jgi:antitoxin ParD1/3/4
MAKRIQMNVSLTPELGAFVRSEVLRGRYQSDSEVVRQGLRLLQEHEVGYSKLKAKIAKGVRQAKRGDFIDGTKVCQILKRRSGSRKPRA